ncbi:MAG: MucB/RseB C-terminal domain-containing protein [Gammaproteobacteria bacterium]|nr:MucB/RseB C-terminal domain-containing protein [Gammaproteobacteria bacterium]
MISSVAQRCFLFSISLIVSGAVVAADNAQEWLMKINRAARNQDYEGVFVYQHDTQLEAMHIFHKMENGLAKERLISLNGSPREIIREGGEVRCYWPDMKSVIVEYRKTDNKNFPAILPERLSDLNKHYILQLGGVERVANRMAQLVLIKPDDDYRYGYHLWAEKETGLLLKADLVDSKGNVLEQFMFTQINLAAKISANDMQPGVAGQGMIWYREDSSAKNKNTSVAAQPAWTATRVPTGFKLSMRMTRRMPTRTQPVEHLVYTDGLATVSVFIEKQEKNVKLFMLGPSRMGAVHALGVRVDDYQITTVGEVPAETIALIGGSVALAQ